MRPRRSRIVLAFVLVAGVAAALLLWRPLKHELDMGAVRAALTNGAASATHTDPSPFVLNLERRALSALSRYVPDTADQFRYLGWSRHLTQGPVVHITLSTDRIDDRLGPALARFSDLRSIAIMGAVLTEEDWTRVSAMLRKLPRLEKVGFKGVQVTDRAIAPLAGHAAVQELSFSSTSVTVASVPTLVTLPSLTELYMSYPIYPVDLTALHKALPSLKVEVR
jgi:hypothetical protein